MFAIKLEPSASNKGFDGHFQDGALAGKSVNIKWCSTRQNLIDLRADSVPDYYLVLAGPYAPTASSRGEDRPWLIDAVFLFEAETLIDALVLRGRRIGIATSVPKAVWQQAEIYPSPASNLLVLDSPHREALELFNFRGPDV